jgi:hypothetical protein
MTLPASGPISLGNTTGDTASSSVNKELYRASPYQQTVSLGDTDVRTLFGVPTGAISLNDGRTKANYFEFTIGSYYNSVNLRDLAIAAGWDGTKAVLAKIAAGTIIYSASTLIAGLVVTGSFPNGVKLENRGNIWGMGGAAGSTGTPGAMGLGGYAGAAGVAGYAAYAGGSAGSGGAGFSGGPAISTTVSIVIDNIGTIQGGTGGLGGSAGVRSGGGGGAGGNYFVPEQEVGGSQGGSYIQPAVMYYGGIGGNGYSYNTGGPFGGAYGGGGLAGQGGIGGTSGNAGAAGNNASGYPYAGGNAYAGGAGGAGGAAGTSGTNGAIGSYIVGNSYVSWISVGTRTGGVIA